MHPKILIDCYIPYIEGRLEPFADIEYLQPRDFTPEKVKDADGLIIRTRTRCDSSLLEGSRVRFIATATIGADHIDMPWCRKAGITALNSAGCNAPAVAQYVWTALHHEGFCPDKGMTLVIIGYGHIGQIVADWGNKLPEGCRILICAPPRQEGGMRDVDYRPMEEILRSCDAITLHVPYTKAGPHATHHLIGRKELEMLGEGAVLINASRGPVVDNEAWRKHLAQKRTRAVIDTWEGEPNIDQGLLPLADIATPHIAGYSLQGKHRAARMCLEAAGKFFGFSPDLSGLTGPYVAPGKTSVETIASSYDIMADDRSLRQNPDSLERLRDNYHYRQETVF